MSHSIKNYFANVERELMLGYGFFAFCLLSLFLWLVLFHGYPEAVKLMKNLPISQALSYLPWFPLVLSLFTTHDFYFNFLVKMIIGYFIVSAIFAAAIVLITLFKDWAYTLHFMNNFSSSYWEGLLWLALFISLWPLDSQGNTESYGFKSSEISRVTLLNEENLAEDLAGALVDFGSPSFYRSRFFIGNQNFSIDNQDSCMSSQDSCMGIQDSCMSSQDSCMGIQD